MHIVESTTASNAWFNTASYVLRHGENVGDLIELLNVATIITDFSENKEFSEHYVSIFGSDKYKPYIDFTFVEPVKDMLGHRVYTHEGNWFRTHYGRMINYYGVNQIENTIKALERHQNIKRCEIIIYDPQRDPKNLYKQPCMLTIDIKPRNGLVYLTCFMRSNTVSKSSYADYLALVRFGLFLARESLTKLGSVTVIAASCHIRHQNSELKKTQALLEEINAHQLTV